MFSKKLSQKGQKIVDDSMAKLETFLSSKDTKLVLENISDFPTYRTLKGKLNYRMRDFTGFKVMAKNGSNKILVSKTNEFESTVDEEEKKESLDCKELESEADIIKLEQDTFDAQWGFTHIVELLIKSGLPLIGHNQMYDICYFYR